MRALAERTLWVALGVGLAALALAYQSPRSLFVDIGGPFDEAITPGFYAPEQSGQATYRWSAAKSALLFRGVGRPSAPIAVRLQLSSGRGTGSKPVQVTATVNGHAVAPLALSPVSAQYDISIDPAWIGPSGDVRLDFTSPTFKAGSDRRGLGFQADFVRLDMPLSPTLPSLTQLLWLLACGLLFYWLLRSLWLLPRAAGLLTGFFLLAGAGVIATQRLLLTPFTARLAATLALALVVTLVAETLTRWLVRLAGWSMGRSLPEWAWAGLRALVAFAVVLKVGGLLYPGSFLVDAPFHLKYVTYMAEVFQGRSYNQFFGPSLAFSVMPQDEWGPARAFIPYSPFFYIVAAPLTWLPFPLTISVPLASGIFEALKVALVFILGLGLGNMARPLAAGRAALAAASAYSIIPANFLLQQWGTWPTLTSLWLVALWAALTCLLWKRMAYPIAWLASTAALTLALLAYTVTAVYTGIFIGLLVVVGWIFAPAERKRWAAVALSGVAGAALSLLIYYGQYVGQIIRSTLPTFGQAIEEQGKLTTLRPSVGSFITEHLASALQSYDLALLYGLAVAGVLWVFWARKRPARTHKTAGRGRAYGITAWPGSPGRAGSVPWQRVWLGVWLFTTILFTLADYWVDQAFKEFWYSLPAVAVVVGSWMLALLSRGGRLYNLFFGLLVASLAWQSVYLWVFRLFFHIRT